MFLTPRNHKVSYFTMVLQLLSSPFFLQVLKNIVKHTLLDHPKKPVLAMNGKRVSFAPQSEHPNASLESFSELLFVLSCMSFMRVLWTWVEGGQASLRSAFRCVGSFSSSFWRYVKPSWRHLATTWRQDGALERQDGQDSAQERQHEPT